MQNAKCKMKRRNSLLPQIFILHSAFCILHLFSQLQVFINRAQHASNALVVHGIRRGSIENQALPGQIVFRIGKSDGRFISAVTIGLPRSVGTETVAYGVSTILVVVDDEPQRPIHDVLERVIEHANAMPGDHRFNGLRRDDGCAIQRSAV